MEGWYEVDEELICHACAADAKWQESNKPEDRPAGLVPRVIDTRPPDKPLSPLTLAGPHTRN